MWPVCLLTQTLECAISLELILSATAGRATHGDTRTDTHRHTHMLPEGEGPQQVPAGGRPRWLAGCHRAGGPFWGSALSPDTDTLHTHGDTGPGQPPGSAATPGRELSAQDAVVRQARQRRGPRWWGVG